jgi:hypothetical protein
VLDTEFVAGGRQDPMVLRWPMSLTSMGTMSSSGNSSPLASQR